MVLPQPIWAPIPGGLVVEGGGRQADRWVMVQVRLIVVEAPTSAPPTPQRKTPRSPFTDRSSPDAGFDDLGAWPRGAASVSMTSRANRADTMTAPEPVTQEMSDEWETMFAGLAISRVRRLLEDAVGTLEQLVPPTDDALGTVQRQLRRALTYLGVCA
jgi:hypothetical protein